MNLTESLAFDTEAAREEVEAEEDVDGNCDSHYPMLAYEIIDLLKIELARLHIMESEPTTTEKKPMTIDFTKPLQTRNGLPVTLVSTEGRGRQPVMAYIGDSLEVSRFNLDGMWRNRDDREEHSLDLMNVPETKVRYTNVYSRSNNFNSRSEADNYAGPDRIACIRSEYKEGQFDA